MNRQSQKRNADSSGDAVETVTLGFDMAWQWNLLLYSLILGVILGVFFDLMRISRVFLSLHGTGKVAQIASETVLTAVSFIEDIIFFVVSAVTLVLFCFQANGGTARGFILLGALGGFFIYLETVGRLTKLISNALARLIYRILSFIWRRMLMPIARVILHLILKLYKLTLGRAVDRVFTWRHKHYTEKSAGELTLYCSRLFIKTKGLQDETGTDVHTGEARNIFRIPVFHNHPGKRSNRVQSARGGT
ncbi:MAG: spore cortex biosynthesis protein YabQ [Clostridia bacterium]|nr:spore cortex biosynthesis protein YabQ [Clostridia bacterium]